MWYTYSVDCWFQNIYPNNSKYSIYLIKKLYKKKLTVIPFTYVNTVIQFLFFYFVGIYICIKNMIINNLLWAIVRNL